MTPPSTENVETYAGLIREADNGSTGAQLALKEFLKNVAGNLPIPLLIEISEVILEDQREQLRQQLLSS